MPAPSDPASSSPVVASTKPAPSPVQGADLRNRRLLRGLFFGGLFMALLVGAFFYARHDNPAALKARPADLVQSLRPKTPAGPVPLLERGTGIENQGFAAARPAREAPPAPAASAPPATAPAAMVEPPTPAVPAAISAGTRHRFPRADAAARPGPAARGVVPSFQLIQCKLVGALESGRSTGAASSTGLGGGGGGGRSGGEANSTPIIALVDEDVRTWDTQEVIIPKGTQCVTVGRFEQGRDRVFVDTDFTFILPGRGRFRTPLELVLPGIAEDREYDAALDTWSLTDLSAGIRGDFIQTRNWDELLLFTAKFLSGASSALSATSPSSFGQAYNNGATSAATGLSGYAINPTVAGGSAVLDQEAARIANRIEQDGYFLRVPAHKQFYVLIRRGYSLADALPSDQAEALRSKHEDDGLRVRDERTARARAAENAGSSLYSAPPPTTLDPATAALLARANQANAGGDAGLRRPTPLSAPRSLPTPAATPIPYTGDSDADALPAP